MNMESYMALCFLPKRFVEVKDGRDMTWLTLGAPGRWVWLWFSFARKVQNLPQSDRSLLGVQAPGRRGPPCRLNHWVTSGAFMGS